MNPKPYLLMTALVAASGIAIANEDKTHSASADAKVKTNAAMAETELRAVDKESMLDLAQLPEPVRQTIEREGAGREIADIDREESDDQVVYEVEFRDSMLNPQIHVKEDGTLLRDNDEVRNWFAGTQLKDTPPAVQETIKRELGDGKITDIDVERRTGDVVYEVEIENAEGDDDDIHIAANGTLIEDERTAAE